MAHKEIIADHLPDTLNRVTGAGLGMTWASAGWAWLGANQSSITAACAIVGLGLTIYGVWRGRGQ